MSKTYLLSGCGSGIGRHTAMALVRRGDRVCATDINAEALAILRKELASPENLRTETLDVRDPQAWDKLVTTLAADWGRLDVVMNIAGYLKPGYVHEEPAEEVHRHFDINTKGVVFGTQAAARQMLRQGGGHIINIASLAGIAPVPGLNLYSASKFAVRGYSLSAAMDLAPRGVKLTVICPDAVQTPMLDLQVDYEQAAMTFSGSAQALTADDITRAIFHALEKAPIEITLPASRGRIAKLGSAFPGLSGALLKWLRERGRKQQQKRAKAR
ncbi:SDR family oxidoreductase [Solimonas sp. K1W22B-7]|uniref:SDR family oxidoreductase n=1 Tax=Solimonas sp. K1W22B-7 TaxID=2303331 RepID=UPI000E335324|nr:SDR family oxidoreductase [Solimonas sp. K1W22B-7]AXQ30009.1 SDR family oxidoreductase [Solimonas sp. K1W22B-7]